MRVCASQISRLAVYGFCTLILSIAAPAQSTDQNFPTPVTTNEISGGIKARDMGDSRVTSYFFAFDGGQGDIFINVVTRNFSGDIDVFAGEDLRPMTKMVIYPDIGASETGRLIYLRKPERLMLRIQGRTPNDDPAAFKVKFGGSFIALAGQTTESAPTISPSESAERSRVKVNSVGTIISVTPKHPPKNKPVEAAKDPGLSAKQDSAKTDNVPIVKSDEARSEPPSVPAKSEPSDIKADEKKTDTVYENPSAKVVVDPGIEPAKEPGITTPVRPRKTPPTSNPAKRPKPEVPDDKTPDPLASIRLVIELKEGKLIERPMSEVLRFSVDKGILTVIAKDGNITRYSILDVAKVTIQ